MIYLRFLLCWTWVLLPLGWGFYQSVQKSLPLFGVETVKTASAAPAVSSVAAPSPHTGESAPAAK